MSIAKPRQTAFIVSKCVTSIIFFEYELKYNSEIKGNTKFKVNFKEI